jgi:hypothetical protein
MTTYSKQLIINKFKLPKDICNMIKDYLFHIIKKIHKNDIRYEILLTIPYKEYDPNDGVTYVYMDINENKDYFLTYSNFEIQLQTFFYENNIVYGIDAHRVTIK